VRLTPRWDFALKVRKADAVRDDAYSDDDYGDYGDYGRR